MRNSDSPRSPRWLDRLAEVNIVGFIISAYLLETSATSTYFQVAQVVLVVSAFCIVVHSARLTSGLLVPWAGALWVTASVAVLVNQAEFTPEFRTFAVNCVLAVALLQLLSSERRVVLGLTAFGIGGLLAAVSLLVQIDPSVPMTADVSQAWSLRLGSSLPGANPNIAGMYLAIAFGAALSRALAPSMRRVLRLCWLSASAVILLAASLTGSRKVMIYCVVAALVLVAHFSLRLLPILVAAAAAVAWALLNIEWLYVIVGHRLVGQGDVTESDALRVQALEDSIDAFLAHPEGTGWGSSQQFLSVLNYTHSNYLEVLVSVGLVGLVAYYLIHLRILSGVRRMGAVVGPAISASVIAGLALDVVQVTYLYKAPLLMLTLGAAAFHAAPRKIPSVPDRRTTRRGGGHEPALGRARSRAGVVTGKRTGVENAHR